MKSIVILGSTGSIGTNTLDIVERFPDQFRVVGLTAGNNDEMLAEQIRRFRPQAVAMSTEAAAVRLKQRCAGLRTEVLSGPDGLAKVASLPDAETTAYGAFFAFLPVEETARIGLVYRHETSDLTDFDDDSVTLQFLWSLGPHKVHTF